MGIKDMGDTQRNPFPPVGNVRLGIKDEKGNPRDVDYFVVAGEGNAPDLVAHYGEKPRELLAWLVFPRAEQNFQTSYSLFSGGGLRCMGDGDHILVATNPKGAGRVISEGVAVQDYREVTPTGEKDIARGEVLPCPGRRAKENPLYTRCLDCGPSGLLRFIVRDPKNPGQPVDGRMVTYRLGTHGWNSVRNLMDELGTMELVCQRVGRDMVLLPVILRRIKGNSTYTGTDGKQHQGSKYYVHVEMDNPAQILAAAASAVLPAPAPAPLVFESGVVEFKDEPERDLSDHEWVDVTNEEPPARSETLPFPPSARIETFNQADWAGFYPWIAKHYNQKPSAVNKWLHNVTGFKSMTECPWTFAELVQVLDQHTEA